ncbi:MAG: hypothetical protein U0936_18165 [Planctomycetaceae bacterium]
MSRTYSLTGPQMADFQPFDTAATTGSSNDRCESTLVLRHGWTFGRTLGRLLLIVVLAAMTSGRAFASCGDYLHTRTSSPAASMGHDSAEATLRQHGERKIPCSGPECRSVPRFPTIPPVVPGGAVRNSELAMVDFGILIDSSSPQNAFVCICSARVTRGFPAQIDVPPECA